MASVLVWSTSTPQGAYVTSWNRWDDDDRVVGFCTYCGSTEVRLNLVTGHADLSAIGESGSYPTGHGCEVCD